jgi:hypothetical protein
MDSLNTRFIEGIRLLRLCGNDTERAKIHAQEVLKLGDSERKKIALNPLSQKNQTLLTRALESSTAIPEFLKKTLVRTVLKVYEETILRHHHSLDERVTNRIIEFAKQSGMPERELIFSLYQPDFLMVLASISSEKVSPHFLSGIPGCSTAVVRTGNDGALTLLRNLDYPAADHWEKWQTVFFHEPSEPQFQKYVSVSSLGIHLAGLSGVNESGIGFSLHAHFSKKFSLKGTPIFYLGQEILESAHTIDEAVFLCKNFRTIGSWAINLASARENRAVTVEMSDGKTFVREMSPDDPAHAHANGFQCTEFRKNELHFCGSFQEDIRSRKASLEENLTVELEKTISLQDALRALASHRDHETGEIRLFGNTVSVVTTIQSMAFDLKNKRIHVSTRNETPTPLGPFVSIPTDWNTLATESNPSSLTHLDQGFSQDFLKALHCYHQAYCSWHVYSEKPERTLEKLIEATEYLKTDPHLWMQRGYFELLLAQTHGHFEVALSCFEKALQGKLSTHHELVAHYFHAACLDLNGRHSLAVEDYELILNAPTVDAKLRKKALIRRKKPFQISNARTIVPDLQFVEPLEYS